MHTSIPCLIWGWSQLGRRGTGITWLLSILLSVLSWGHESDPQCLQACTLTGSPRTAHLSQVVAHGNPSSSPSPPPAFSLLKLIPLLGFWAHGLAEMGDSRHYYWFPDCPEGQKLGETSCTGCVQQVRSLPLDPQPEGTALLLSCPDWLFSVPQQPSMITMISILKNSLCASSSGNPRTPPR